MHSADGDNRRETDLKRHLFAPSNGFAAGSAPYGRRAGPPCAGADGFNNFWGSPHRHYSQAATLAADHKP